MRIELARLYAKTRRDGATTLSGRVGYDGRLRIEPNPQHDPDDPKSPDFLAFIEYAQPQTAPFKGPQIIAPTRTPRALVESEIVD